MSVNYLTIEQISRKLHISPGTARNRLSRLRPMPPSMKIGRRRLFPEVEFEEWMSKYLESSDSIQSDSQESEK